MITKSDDVFRSEYVEFVWGMDELDLEELIDLFKKVVVRSLDFSSRESRNSPPFTVVCFARPCHAIHAYMSAHGASLA